MSKPIANTIDEQVALLDINKPVRVYRNLHSGLWSVKQGSIVRFHCNLIHLRNVRFLVNEKVRQRVIAKKRKEVHAFVEGHICTPAVYFYTYEDRWYNKGLVRYNPYEAGHFMFIGKACKTAGVCRMEKVWDGMKVFGKDIAFLQNTVDTELCSDILCEQVSTHLL